MTTTPYRELSAREATRIDEQNPHISSSPSPQRPQSTHTRATRRPTPARPGNTVAYTHSSTAQSSAVQSGTTPSSTTVCKPSQRATPAAQRSTQQRSTHSRTPGTLRNAKRYPLITTNDVCGQMGLWTLEARGVLCRLDATCGYLTQEQYSVASRAHIVRQLIPQHTVASGYMAYWVWMGGDFPSCIDIISTSHYWTMIVQRPVHASNRVLDDHHIITSHGLSITSPLRTVCDISCFRMKGSQHLPSYIPAVTQQQRESNTAYTWPLDFAKQQAWSFDGNARETNKLRRSNEVNRTYGTGSTYEAGGTYEIESAYEIGSAYEVNDEQYRELQQETLVLSQLQRMLLTYDIAISDCLTQLWDNNRWPDRKLGIRRFTMLSPYASEPNWKATVP